MGLAVNSKVAPRRAATGSVDSGFLEGVVANSDVVITCGSGGVGKTTVAAAIGFAAAVNTSRRVLVVTIDPAKRLADALGLESIGNVETRVDLPGLKGEFWVAMLDTSASWNDLIARHAPDASTATKILANPLYRNITQRFVQSHDYIAMERLFDLRSEGRFDLIVIDTPPTRHALDFLDAPERMADFFSSALLRWITLPYRTFGAKAGRLGYLAAKPFYQVADRILGSQFLQDIAEFFLLFQGMYDGFVQRANAVTRLLHDPRTSFVVVSSPEPAPLHEAEFFLRELATRQLRVGALVLNRVLPSMFLDEKTRLHADQLLQASQPGALGDLAADLAKSYVRFSSLARRQQEEIRRFSQQPECTLSVPLLDVDVDPLGGVRAIGEVMWSPET